MRRLAPLIIILSLAACADAPGAQAPTTSPSTTGAPDARSRLSAIGRFDGLIVPRSATKLRAPQSSFRIGDWTFNSGWIELIELKPDGELVKEGEIVAKFDFPGKQAKGYVQDRMNQAQAEQTRAQLSVGDALTALRAGVQRNDIAASRALIDTRREGVVSARELDRLRIEHRLADFEAGAQRKQVSAYERAVGAERAYLERRVVASNSDMTRYESLLNSFSVRAPHDGVVRHGFMRRQRRKVQKGDGMGSGHEFMTIARDASLELELYIPEHRYALLSAQRRFIVQSPASSNSYEVEVSQVDEFPQELGFIKGDDNMPGAREKLYIVRAQFVTPPKELGAGQEVKVRLP